MRWLACCLLFLAACADAPAPGVAFEGRDVAAWARDLERGDAAGRSATTDRLVQGGPAAVPMVAALVRLTHAEENLALNAAMARVLTDMTTPERLAALSAAAQEALETLDAGVR